MLGDRPADIAERLLADAPRLIGFGVYIWNVEETTRLIAIIKRVAPDVLRHRVLPTYEADAEGLSSDKLVARVLETVATP